MAGRIGFAFASTAFKKTKNPNAIRNTARNRFNRRFPVTPSLDAEISYRWPEEKISNLSAAAKANARISTPLRFRRGCAQNTRCSHPAGPVLCRDASLIAPQQYRQVTRQAVAQPVWSMRPHRHRTGAGNGCECQRADRRDRNGTCGLLGSCQKAVFRVGAAKSTRPGRNADCGPYGRTVCRRRGSSPQSNWSQWTSCTASGKSQASAERYPWQDRGSTVHGIALQCTQQSLPIRSDVVDVTYTIPGISRT